MRNLLPLFLSLLLFALMACQDESTKKIEPTFAPTHGGYQIKFNKDVPGPLTKVGDLVYYHISHRNGNTVTFSSKLTARKPYSFLIERLAPGTKVSPVLVALLQMSPGDEVTLRIDLETQKFKEPGYEYAKFKDMDISLVKIEKGEHPVLHSVKQRLMEPKDFAQDYDFNSSTKKIAQGSNNGQTTDEMWNLLMEKKLKDVLFDLGNMYRTGELSELLIRLPSGVQYFEVQKGSYKKFDFNKKIWLKYFGSNMEGRPFEKKYKKTEVEEVNLGTGKIVKGLEEGIQQLHEGGSGIFFIPPNLAFGEKGTKKVKPNAQFVVYFAKVERFL